MTNFTPPAPTAWTLRLKHHRTTLLFHLDPLQTFAILKKQLLAALRETEPSGTLNGNPLPTSPSEIVLGRPVDVNDLRKGFVTGEWERAEFGDEEMEVEEPAKKGRAKKQVTAAGDCPKGAKNVRDGGVLAFWWGEDTVARSKGKGKMLTDGEGMELDAPEEKWDVVLPNYDDMYGDTETA
jgi:hypothetical protein